MTVWIVRENTDGFYDIWDIRAVFSEPITDEEAYDVLESPRPLRLKDGTYDRLGQLMVEEFEVRTRC